MRKSQAAASLLAAALAAILAGCAVPPAAKSEGNARITKVERRSWNEPPEPDLYQVVFDAARSRDIRRQIGDLATLSDRGLYGAEIEVLEREADRELRANGLCSGLVGLVPPIISAEGDAEIRALFRCRRGGIL